MNNAKTMGLRGELKGERERAASGECGVGGRGGRPTVGAAANFAF